MSDSSHNPLIENLHVAEGGKALVVHTLIGDVQVNRETLPQPKLDLFETLRENDSQIRLTDLQFKRRANFYLPRPVLENKVFPWLLSDDPFRLLKVTGPAGMGKSRLALELCDSFHRRGWLAGFINAKQNWPDPWTPARDTLAVLDYAASKRFGDRTAFEWLQSIYTQSKRLLEADQPAKCVRIVLLDRSDQGPLWSDWKASEIALDLDERTLAVDLTPDRAEFDAIVMHELKRRQRVPSAADRQAIAAVAERLHDQFRPLFALLTAAALAEGKLHVGTVWSPELLLESILKSQRRQWETAGITDEHLDLLFEATLTQGASGNDPEFCNRVEGLDQATLDSLATLSEPIPGTVADSRIGPIAPDLLGEFFLLMRLRGDRQMHLKRQTASNQRIARAMLERAWGCEPAESFLGRLLEDYLPWVPPTGANPALYIMNQALAKIETGRATVGLQYCCFAVAWKRPIDRDWSAWLNLVPHHTKSAVAAALSIGLYNATVGEPDPATRLALADRIETLHTRHGEEAAVREQLANALFNATAVEPDPATRMALADRIERLHTRHGQEAAVREQLANALFNATAVEPDPATRMALADRIERLHTRHGQEAAIREPLAKALYNATVVEPDPATRMALADRLQRLHTRHGQEAAVREPLAKALYNATVGEPDPAKCLALADRIERLHTRHGEEAAVREQLAKALVSITVGEPDPATRMALADRIETLHTRHGEEAAVREPLAKALLNATVVEPDPAKCLALADRIETLHTRHGQEAAVRERLAKALYNATVGEPDPAKCLALADRIETLHTRHGQEAAVREHLAKALLNTTVVEPDPAKRLALADRIEILHTRHGEEAAVREHLAKALYNATVVEPDPAKLLALADRIETLHTRHGQEAAVREQLANALYNTTVVEPDPATRLALADRIETLHTRHGEEAAVRKQLAKALFSTTVVEPDPAKRLALADRIETLHTRHGEEAAVREHLAKALFNATAVEPDSAKNAKQVERLTLLIARYPQEPIMIQIMELLRSR